jgi:hypothetical protein
MKAFTRDQLALILVLAAVIVGLTVIRHFLWY